VSVVSIETATGSLVIGGERIFPIVLSNPPPLASTAPSGRNGWAEVAAGGVNFVRSGIRDWNAEFADGQIANERSLLDAAASNGLRCWTWLGGLTNLPAAAGSVNEQLLTKVVNALKGHPALGAWKGVDEPALAKVPPAGVVRGYQRLRALDPHHPLVIIEAPLGTVAELAPFAAACDVTGADIYPVSYPPGIHASGPNTDPSVVGDVTRRMAKLHEANRCGRPCRLPGAACFHHNTCRASRPCLRSASWPTKPSSPARAGSRSSAATSRR
jgi:hypothetical protein